MSSQFFHFSVNNFSPSFIKKLQAKATCKYYLKHWLRLPRCATLSTLFHLKVLNLPYLPHCLEKAKLRCLTTMSASLDSNITELMNCRELVESGLSIPKPCISIFSAAVQSISQEVVKQDRVTYARLSHQAPLFN